MYKKQLKHQPSKIIAFRPTGWTHSEKRTEVHGTQVAGNITIYSEFTTPLYEFATKTLW